jgi:hypothetical protein
MATQARRQEALGSMQIVRDWARAILMSIQKIEGIPMSDRAPQDVSNFHSMIDFLRRHPLYTDECSPKIELNEEYSTAIRAAFPEGGDAGISVVEETVTRRKLTLLGLEIVHVGRLLDQVADEEGNVVQVGYTDGVVVRLPDGSTFAVTSGYDLAELRTQLKLPPLQPTAEAEDKLD